MMNPLRDSSQWLRHLVAKEDTEEGSKASASCGTSQTTMKSGPLKAS